MKKIYAVLILSIFLAGCDLISGLGDTSLGSALSQLSQTEMGVAVRDLLTKSATNAIVSTGAQNGFFGNSAIKIVTPSQVNKVKDFCIKAGLSSQVNAFEEKLNRAAEDASAGCKEIFLNAVKQMTINDALSIITGENDAATKYMQKTTTAQLKTKVSSVVKSSIEKVKLASYWSPLATKYNAVMRVTGGQEVTTDLNAYVTDKTVAGIFNVMRTEERKIRTQTSQQTTPALKKAFSN